jgi:hypothetical protein
MNPSTMTTTAIAASAIIAHLHGLELVAVAVVAQAVWGMTRTLTPDREQFMRLADNSSESEFMRLAIEGCSANSGGAPVA